MQSRKQGKGVLGVGYVLTDRAQLFAGISAQDYDPAAYRNRYKSPYKSPGVVFKLNIDVFVGD